MSDYGHGHADHAMPLFSEAAPERERRPPMHQPNDAAWRAGLECPDLARREFTGSDLPAEKMSVKH